jgi:G3E family GTPase
MPDSRIPVTILTGFLGAGKTSVLNELIRQYPDKRIAVIENEFGEIGIDSELVLNKEGNIFELSNGCICCSLNEDLTNTLHLLLERSDKIDYLIIETTGIADPGPVCVAFLSDEQIQDAFRLDAVVTVVDSTRFEQQLEAQAEVGKQVALADVLIFNKVSDTDLYLLETAKNILKRINPQAEVIEADHGIIKNSSLLDKQAFDAEKILKQPWKKPPSSLMFASPPTHENHIAFNSHSFEWEEPLDFIRFTSWITLLLHLNAKTVFRIKGILNISEIEEKVVFQSVYDKYVSQSGGKWEEGEVRKTRLVFIGKNLDREILEKGIRKCLDQDPSR